MAFVTIPPTDTDQDSPITEDLMTQLADNAQQNRDDLENEHGSNGAHDQPLGQDLNMGGFSPTNLGEGTGTTDAVRADRALSSGDGSISGVGNLTADRNLQVVDDTNIQQVIVSLNGTPVATRSEINLNTPASLGNWNVTDNPGQNRVDIDFQPESQVANLTSALSSIWIPSQSDKLVDTPRLLTTTPTTIATVSASRTCWKALVTLNHVGTDSDGDHGYSLWVVPNGGSAADANKIASHDRSFGKLRPGEELDIELAIALEAGGTIVARSESSGTLIACRVSIWETTDSNFISAAPAILTTSYATLRTLSAAASAVSVILHNYSASDAGAAVMLRPSGGSDEERYLINNYEANLIRPGERREILLPHNLGSGGTIRLRASAATAISARVSTIEGA